MDTGIDPVAIAAEFGIRASRAVQSTDASLTSVYVIDDAYVLRTRISSYSLDTVLENERELLEAVHRLIPVTFPELLSTQNGKKHVIAGGEAWTLYPLIKGETVCGWTELYYALNAEQWKLILTFMRDIHEKTQGNIPATVPRYRFSSEINLRLQNLADSINVVVRTRIQTAIERVAQYEVKHETHCFVHGDMHPGNMIIRNGIVVGLIDVDSCHAGTYLEDLAYLMMMALRDYRNGEFTSLDRTLFERILNWYGVPQSDLLVLNEYVLLGTLFDLDLFTNSSQMSKQSFYVGYQHDMLEKLSRTL